MCFEQEQRFILGEKIFGARCTLKVRMILAEFISLVDSLRFKYKSDDSTLAYTVPFPHFYSNVLIIVSKEDQLR